MSSREWQADDGHSAYPDDSTDTPVNWRKPQIKKRPTKPIRLLILAVISILVATTIFAVAAAWVITVGWLKLIVLFVLIQL